MADPKSPETLSSQLELSYTTASDEVVAHRHLPPGGRHIMVAVDLSDHSFAAAKFAFENFVRENDVVSVVQAIAPVEAILGRHETPGEVRRDAMIELHTQVKRIREETGKQNIPFRVDIDWGDPRQVILSLAEKHAATFIVVGSRGRSALKGVLLGSISQFILANAKIPVVITRCA